MSIKAGLLDIYDKHYKSLMIITFVLLFVAIGYLGYKYATTGEFVNKGISLRGGITFTAETNTADVDAITAFLTSEFPASDINVRALTNLGQVSNIIIEATDVNEQQMIDALHKYGMELKEGTYTAEFIGSSLGESFFRQTMTALIVAFISMSIVVFITFRNAMPSLFVILAAVSDVICTLAVISFMGVKLGTTGIAGFLMLIGYSVDTDILLTTRVLRRKEGTIFQRTMDALPTGMLMSLTSFGAVFVAYFMTESDAIKQIMLILSVGLIFDILYTWIQNAGILRWYLENKEKKHGHK